ncbi:MAG: hypothetical protein ABFS21_07915 [Actinomycetota bacterium]
MRHHGRGRGRGRGRYAEDELGYFGSDTRRGGLGLHLYPAYDSRYGQLSTRDRIERLEGVQRDLEQMAADVAGQLELLKTEEAEHASM